MVEILGQGGPGDVEFDIALQGHQLLLHRVRQWAHRPPLPEYLQGDALTKVALTPAVLEQRLRGPAQHVDEPGGDGESAGIDLGAAGARQSGGHGRDAVPQNGHVAGKRSRAGPVVHGAAADDQVVCLGGPTGPGQQ